MTLFISDLHLCEQRPVPARRFIRFLEQDARNAGPLYILGDLFEAWLGDDDTSDFHSEITQALHACVSKGTPVFLLHGNRDFLIGTEFERHTGCRLLPDPSVIDLDGIPALIMHGDTLCTDDLEYQEFRVTVRDPQWQQKFLAQPLSQRREIAQHLRDESQMRTREKPEQIMDVNQQTVEHVMRDHHVNLMIHGHTHRPAMHDFTLDGEPVRRIVLGDWYEQGSVLTHDAHGFMLSQLPFRA
ncbi:MAG: UDP-2,3-diacylglucosamine diphosphatase [Gammaproteobacteria bacterium]|nr:UDP-2,3-diacylglucosamine diphosphatase [Gammaproteobacteria bacterium]